MIADQRRAVTLLRGRARVCTPCACVGVCVCACLCVKGVWWFTVYCHELPARHCLLAGLSCLCYCVCVCVCVWERERDTVRRHPFQEKTGGLDLRPLTGIAPVCRFYESQFKQSMPPCTCRRAVIKALAQYRDNCLWHGCLKSVKQQEKKALEREQIQAAKVTVKQLFRLCK